MNFPSSDSRNSNYVTCRIQDLVRRYADPKVRDFKSPDF